jgi:hypothetical protein
MLSRSLAITVTLSLLAACGKETTVSSPNGAGAEIKFVHASAHVGPVDVYVAGNRVIAGVPFGRTSATTPTIAGLQRVTLRSGASVIDEIDASIAPHEVTAIILTDDSAQATPAQPDTGVAPVNNRANIRLVNVAGSNTSPPTMLDVLIRAPDFPLDSVPKLGLDTRVSSHGPMMYFNPGSFRFTFVPQGGSTVLAQVAFDVAAGEKRSVVLERDAGGQYRATVVVEP